MLSNRQQHCLHGIGIQYWVAASASEIEAEIDVNPVTPLATHLPAATIVEEVSIPAPAPVPAAISTTTLTLENWPQISTAIENCQSCELAMNCTQKVSGVGDQQASLMIIGDAPGHDEDIQGEAFVGRAGKLLDKMLQAIGITRDQIFITSIVKCRPPNNRDPKQQEAEQCRTFLEAQIKQVSPKVILSVGRFSAQSLLNSKASVSELIAQPQQLPGSDIPVKVSYHPAYLLRHPEFKPAAWNDLKQLRQMLSDD